MKVNREREREAGGGREGGVGVKRGRGRGEVDCCTGREKIAKGKQNTVREVRERVSEGPLGKTLEPASTIVLGSQNFYQFFLVGHFFSHPGPADDARSESVRFLRFNPLVPRVKKIKIRKLKL